MCILNVPVYAGTHGDVLNPHTEGVLYIHTESRGSSLVLLTKFAHVLLSRDSEVHQRNQWILPIFSLRIGREQHVADSSKHSLYLMKLFSSSNPEDTAEGIVIRLFNLGNLKETLAQMVRLVSPLLLPPSSSPPSTTTSTTTTQHNTTHNTQQTETQTQTQTQRKKTKPKFYE